MGDGAIGLMRLRGATTTSRIAWLNPDGPGALVSALLARDPEEGALVVNNVEADVSTMHARVRFHPGVGWAVTGLGSRNGTVIKRPAQHETVVVEPPRDDAETARPAAVGDAANNMDGAGASGGEEKRPLPPAHRARAHPSRRRDRLRQPHRLLRAGPPLPGGAVRLTSKGPEPDGSDPLRCWPSHTPQGRLCRSKYLEGHLALGAVRRRHHVDEHIDVRRRA